MVWRVMLCFRWAPAGRLPGGYYQSDCESRAQNKDGNKKLQNLDHKIWSLVRAVVAAVLVWCCVCTLCRNRCSIKLTNVIFLNISVALILNHSSLSCKITKCVFVIQIE